MEAVLFNTRGYLNSAYEIQQILTEKRLELVLITETHLLPKHKVTVPGYMCYRKDRTSSKGGGVMILVQENIAHEPIAIPSATFTEIVGIKLKSGNRTTTVICL